MSDFVMVVPPDWVEVSTSWIGESNSIDEVNYMLSTESWGDIENILRLGGAVPEGKHVLSARLITLNDGYHLWVLFG